MNPEQAEFEIRKLAKQGAKAILEELGFIDEKGKIDKEAVSDFRELRGLLSDWRGLKKKTISTIFTWVGWLLLGILSVKLGISTYINAVKGNGP